MTLRLALDKFQKNVFEVGPDLSAVFFFQSQTNQ